MTTHRIVFLFLTVLMALNQRVAASVTSMAESRWCPSERYPSDKGTCELCYSYCGREGCTGPGNHVGGGGCRTCWLGVQVNVSQINCISPFVGCLAGYYAREVNVSGYRMMVCFRCHSLCRTCSGPGLSNCDACRFHKINGKCVRRCPGSSSLTFASRTCTVLQGDNGNFQQFFHRLHRDPHQIQEK